MATHRRRDEEATHADENSAIGIGVGGVGGVAAGAATGAAIGTAVAGPVGTPVGALIGAVAGGVTGGFVGNEVAKSIDPKAEESYWQEHHRERPYVQQDASWDHYRPAYRYGVSAATKSTTESENETFDQMEGRLRKGWGHAHGKSSLTWDQARPAVRDAYERTIRLHKEQLHIDKVPVQTGDVRVHKDVVTEHKTVQVPVEREEVVIERRPAHRGAAADSMGAEEIRIPVKEERVNVSKDVVVNEEVNIKKRKVHDTQTVAEDVRHEELREDGNGKSRVRHEKV